MVALWIVQTVVLVLEFSLCSQASTICNCNDTLQTVCVAPSDQVFIPCPSLDQAVDFMFQLIKNQQVLSTFCNRTKSGCNPAIQASMTNQSARNGFKIEVLDKSSHGVYRCEGKKTFKPPIQKESGEGILVLVKGHQCETSTDLGSDGAVGVNTVVWVVVVVCLCLYSLIVSVISASLWVKLRTAECQNDYMNTKPRPTHKQKQKRGRALQV